MEKKEVNMPELNPGQLRYFKAMAIKNVVKIVMWGVVGWLIISIGYCNHAVRTASPLYREESSFEAQPENPPLRQQMSTISSVKINNKWYYFYHGPRGLFNDFTHGQ